jgi:hypothetical protein
MSTETLASCLDDAQTAAVQISAANKTDLTIGKDFFLANVVCWFDSDTARDAASVSVVGMVDRFFRDALFRGSWQRRGCELFQKEKFQRSPVRPLLAGVKRARTWKRGQF